LEIYIYDLQEFLFLRSSPPGRLSSRRPSGRCAKHESPLAIPPGRLSKDRFEKEIGQTINVKLIVNNQNLEMIYDQIEI